MELLWKNGFCIRNGLKNAFTLAEVLITLGIIGIVAALTLPALMSKYKKEETVSKLKKHYSTLSQAFTNAQVEYGDPFTWNNLDLPQKEFEKLVTQNCEDYILPYLTGVLRSGYFSLKNAGYPVYYNIEGNTNTNLSTLAKRFYIIEFADGVTYFFTRESSGYMIIYIDVNGKKGPNIWGKDAFMFQLRKNGRYTAIYIDNKVDRNWLINSCKIGKACSALIIKDGWKIADDYPIRL